MKRRMSTRELVCSRLGMTLLSFGLLQGMSLAAEKDGAFITYPNESGAPGPVVFSHRAHGLRGAGYPCGTCHALASPKAPSAAMDEIRKGNACGSCHNGTTKGPRGGSAAASTQDCSACHMPAADCVILLNRMNPVAFSHERHLAVDPKKKISNPSGFSCGDCHPVPFERASKGSAGMEVPHDSGGCATCHNGKKRRDGRPPAFAANTRCLTCHILPRQQQ